MNQTVKQKRGLIEIVQPIGGIQDYAYEPQEERPMATRNSGGHGLILVASIAFAVLIVVLAVAG